MENKEGRRKRENSDATDKKGSKEGKGQEGRMI